MINKSVTVINSVSDNINNYTNNTSDNCENCENIANINNNSIVENNFNNSDKLSYILPLLRTFNCSRETAYY